MKKLPMIARVLIGLVYTIFGLNGFLGFIPIPAMDGGAGAMMGALAATGYMLPFIKATEVVCGLMLLANFRAPLALTIVTPITLNIAAFHFILDPKGSPMAVALLAISAFLAWSWKDKYRGLLKA